MTYRVLNYLEPPNVICCQSFLFCGWVNLTFVFLRRQTHIQHTIATTLFGMWEFIMHLSCGNELISIKVLSFKEAVAIFL
jgi:hypothetical protein